MRLSSSASRLWHVLYVREPVAFAVVGAAGFLVDAAILALAFHGLQWGHYGSRAASFLAAVSVTWYLNRNWTFAHRATARPRREYSAYVLLQSVGALINIGVYAVCIEVSDLMARQPTIALAFGSGVAMFFNFWACRRIAFTGADMGARVRGRYTPSHKDRSEFRSQSE